MDFLRGNAFVDGKRGWFIGQFVSKELGLRRREDVELKWGVHPKGETRGGRWSSYRTSTTISVLIEGSLLVRLRTDGELHEFLLNRKGEYLIIGPQVEHTWESPEDSIVLTIRCPSVSGDMIERIE